METESAEQTLSRQEAVHREAQRIASLSAVKLFRSRTQRGGMRLHRSLQLALVMRSARELMAASAPPTPQPPAPPSTPPPAIAVVAPEPRENRKRRSCGSRLPGLVPSKRACLSQETPQPQPQGGAFPGLAEVLQRLLRSVQAPHNRGCRGPAIAMPGLHSRAVEAF
ncbi:immediate early response gene 2 protein [Gastrophryne carolinensis]